MPSIPEIAPLETNQNHLPSLNNAAEIPASHTNDSSVQDPATSGIHSPVNLNKSRTASLNRLFRRRKKPQPPQPPSPRSDSDGDTGGISNHDPVTVLSNLISADIDHINRASENLESFRGHISSASEQLKKFKEENSHKDLRELKKTVTRLKLQLVSPKTETQENASQKNRHTTGASSTAGKVPENVVDLIPWLHKSQTFERSSEFENFVALYNNLEIDLKLCLLCFSIFPEKAIIRRSLMVHWWMAEGFVPPINEAEIAGGTKNAEDFGNEYFDRLMKLGFIEPIDRKRHKVNEIFRAGSCRMHPFVREALVKIAKKARFFNFDDKGMPTENFTGCFRACLVGNGMKEHQDQQQQRNGQDHLETLHMIFNVSEHILEFKKEYFSRMKNLNVLFLGRWMPSATHHIEVDETSFLDALNNMNYLKFFSLQGISRITELPDSVTHLSNLVILDLRACHSLDTLPDEIGKLKSLTHLDMSECYMLDHIPKSLSDLSELRVLKGFVVSSEAGRHSCSLHDLVKLEKLTKLGIYTGMRDFPTDKHVSTLQQMVKLRKLAITWGGGTSHPNGNTHNQIQRTNKAESVKLKTPRGLFRRQYGFKSPELPRELEKLDLKCFPTQTMPHWLIPDNLGRLKKLYIRGGKFSDIGQYQELDEKGSAGSKSRWNVQILRLKYLRQLEMDWRELRDLFPNLVYMEKVSCPKLGFFPCDANGVWINKKKLKELRHTAL